MFLNQHLMLKVQNEVKELFNFNFVAVINLSNILRDFFLKYLHIQFL